MLASRWHSPPKLGIGVDLRHRDVQGGQPVGVHRSLTSPSSTPTRTPGSSATLRSSRVVFPAPGALMKFSTVTPARSKSARLARGDRVVRVQRLLDHGHLCPMHAASSSSL